MKKFLFILFVGVVSCHLYAQKSIENPEYGFSTYPGEITKIEVLDTATVMHFKIKKLPWGYFHLFEQSFILDSKDDNKLFVTKLKGANFGRNDFPESGEVMYQLYFPPLRKTVNTIEFGVEKERGWHVYNIVLQEDENAVLLPKELRGNWLLADSSNQWHYGFNTKNAVVDAQVWDYKTIEQKGKTYTITLEHEGQLKTIYAKQGKKGLVAFGSNPEALKEYSLQPVFNPKYQMENDVPFVGSVKSDSKGRKFNSPSGINTRCFLFKAFCNCSTSNSSNAVFAKFETSLFIAFGPSNRCTNFKI